MRNIVATALLCSFGLSLMAVSAAEARPFWKTRVNHRQARQQNRLADGRTDGSLTRRENRRLQARQANLAATEARYRYSGNGLSKGEAAKLERRQDNLSHDIYQQKHDEQARGQ